MPSWYANLSYNQAHYHAVLQQNQVTMTSRLLDAEGFPRADLDIPTIRQARSHIQRLRNDRREVDAQLAILLTHALPPATLRRPQAVAAAQKDGVRARPMAVHSIAPYSPAAEAVRSQATDSRAFKQATNLFGGAAGIPSHRHTCRTCPPL